MQDKKDVPSKQCPGQFTYGWCIFEQEDSSRGEALLQVEFFLKQRQVSKAEHLWAPETVNS